MSAAQINITLGTAGHIDHGKTALVKLLTGCDTDRLKAEKQRGMSIDLGFAPCRIADLEVGIVDVPGHENFIKTMVAGASGMDAVMLVVAADDGVMPQTREHMEILTLLGVRHGFVALTKIDRVDEEHRKLVLEDTRDFLTGTFLEGAPVCPVSSITGDGFEPFLATLCDLLESLQPRSLDGVFRLPVDRAFSAHGHGTIVAGIPVCGTAHVDDEVLLLPEGTVGRIRQIEVYGRGGDTVKAGQCAAVNIRHWDAHDIRRGHVITLPGYFETQQWFVARLRLLRHEKLVLKSGTQLKLHTGTSEVAASIYPLEGDRIGAGEECLVQFRTAAPIVAGPGDHFIIRSLSPVRTIGGGALVEGVARRLKRNRPGLIDDLCERANVIADPRRFVEYAVKHAESGAARENELATRTKTRNDRVREVLAALTQEGKVQLVAPGLTMHRDTMAEMSGCVMGLVEEFHRARPESPGMLLEELRRASDIDHAVLDGLIGAMKTDGRLVERNGRLASAGHSTSFQGEDAKHLDAIEGLFRSAVFHPPGIEELRDKTGTDRRTVERLLKILQEHERLVRVEGGILFHRDAVERARDILVDHTQREGRLESVKFKYLLETTRKFALPLLDHFDRVGVTRRVGNTRYLRK